MIKKKVLLIILDGWGEGEMNISNPFRFARTENLNYLKKNYPFGLLKASGYTVGLSKNELPSCELAHLTIGIGTTYYRSTVKIDLAIESGEFFKNQKLLSIFTHLKKYNSRLHLIGILSKNNTLASFNHLLALLNFCQLENFNKVFLHLFLDGIDSPPRSALDLLTKLLNILKEKGLPGKIASLCGRFYALDTTGDYLLKTRRVYLLINKGVGVEADDPIKILKSKYEKPDFTDYILEPTIFEKDGIIKDNDAVIFFNHEPKTIHQLAQAIFDPNFDKFEKIPKFNLYLSSLTRYLENVNYQVIFEEQKVTMNLTRIISENNLKQIKITDEPHKVLLTYYFNGFFDKEHPGEVIKTFPSFETELPKIEKQLKEVYEYLKLIITEGVFDLIVVNLPIFDIIGHSGNFKTAISAIELIDQFLPNFISFSLNNKYSIILTSDHGNIEKMINPLTGQKDTTHTYNLVPFFLIDNDYKTTKTDLEVEKSLKEPIGSLINISPTVLDLMNLKIPPEFTGKSLLNYFK